MNVNTGNMLMAWLTTMCNYVESPEEFKRTASDMREFLRDKIVEKQLGRECISKALELLDSIVTKECHLANYVRMFLTNCMDAHTTSPVECCNKVMKEHDNVNANKHLHVSLECANEGATKRIDRRKNECLRDMQKTTLSSRASTRKLVISKAQHLADINYDALWCYKGLFFNFFWIRILLCIGTASFIFLFVTCYC
jgi:hypothetical protein